MLKSEIKTLIGRIFDLEHAVVGGGNRGNLSSYESKHDNEKHKRNMHIYIQNYIQNLVVILIMISEIFCLFVCVSGTSILLNCHPSTIPGRPRSYSHSSSSTTRSNRRDHMLEVGSVPSNPTHIGQYLPIPSASVLNRPTTSDEARQRAIEKGKDGSLAAYMFVVKPKKNPIMTTKGNHIFLI